MKEQDLINEIGNFDEQSSALIRIIMNLLDTTKHQVKWLIFALILSVLVNVGIVTGFLIYESQFELSDNITETTNLETNGDNAAVNNINSQYNDSATHNE
jgi:hypothetical protein